MEKDEISQGRNCREKMNKKELWGMLCLGSERGKEGMVREVEENQDLCFYITKARVGVGRESSRKRQHLGSLLISAVSVA